MLAARCGEATAVLRALVRVSEPSVAALHRVRVLALAHRGRGSEQDRSQLFPTTSLPGQHLHGSPQAPCFSPHRPPRQAGTPPLPRDLPAPGWRFPLESPGHPGYSNPRPCPVQPLPVFSTCCCFTYPGVGPPPSQATAPGTCLHRWPSHSHRRPLVNKFVQGPTCSFNWLKFLEGGGCSHPLRSSWNRCQVGCVSASSPTAQTLPFFCPVGDKSGTTSSGGTTARAAVRDPSSWVPLFVSPLVSSGQKPRGLCLSESLLLLLPCGLT